jgi:alkyl hydroperoxide reductase subunit F
MINNTARLNGDSISVDRIMSASNVEVHNNSRVVEITGDKFVEGLRYEESGIEKPLAVRGVFVEIGLDPNSEFARGVEKNGHKEILVNSGAETNVPGVFAAGDVSAVIDKQIIVAAGEGAKAALSAFRYLIKYGA